MAFPKSRILSTQQLIQQIVESNRNGERFCFILGSGASVESKIPTGNELEMRWMNCIMGEKKDEDTPPMDPEASMAMARTLYEDKLIHHEPEKIVAAWKDAKENKKTIPSDYYFDIYKLRFYPNRRNGYRYLERIMESKDPSLGYHTLALLLTEGNLNNLVLTTNFDNLAEDALFLYTDKKPLVVSHESLAGYIESDIQRPIIAKIHRGLMYAPFNSPETTNELKGEWREALNYAFSTYTPIVIGYGGGDHSLMSFLEDENTAMRHGLYWCYREASGLPDENIQKFVEKKDGYFVSIGGFDALMMEIGKARFKDRITPTGTNNTLKYQYDRRIQKYSTQWEELNKVPEMKEVLEPMNVVEQQAEKDRKLNNELTAWDYERRGYRALDDKKFQEAVEAFTKAIELRGFADDYNNRGIAYGRWNKYEKAIEDFSKAILLDPRYAIVYANRGLAYARSGQYQEAIEDSTKAIELDASLATAYGIRGWAYDETNHFDKALTDYDKAIELDPLDGEIYNNRAFTYSKSGQYQQALDDCMKSIELDPQNYAVYHTRGYTYLGMEKHHEAIADFSKSLELNPEYKDAYVDRARAYRAIGEEELAKADEEKAAAL